MFALLNSYLIFLLASLIDHFLSKRFSWNVIIKQEGRAGSVDYCEGSRKIRFDWEFGGGNVVVILRWSSAFDWEVQNPWAAGRKREIMERIAQEVIRQKAHDCVPQFNEAATMIQLSMKG